MIFKETLFQTTRLQNNKKAKYVHTTKNNKNIKDNKRLQKHRRHQTNWQQRISKSQFIFFTGQQRPSTGKEARRQRSAKITADLENDAPVFDDDFYRYSFVYLSCF